MLQLANTTKRENNLYNMHKWIAITFRSKHPDDNSYIFGDIGEALFFASIQYAIKQGATSFADIYRICSTKEYFSIAQDEPNRLLNSDEFHAQKRLLADFALKSENVRGAVFAYVCSMLEDLAQVETKYAL